MCVCVCVCVCVCIMRGVFKRNTTTKTLLQGGILVCY